MTTRVWLITGCSTGFGRALAEVLLQRGERVVVTARDAAKLDDFVRNHGDRVLAQSLDITQEHQIAAVVAAAEARFSSIDVLVNNAGYGAVGAVEQTSIDMARAVMETNYFGTLAMIRGVLPAMLARASGQIVNVGSVAGQVGFPLLGYYCASKFALAGLSESLAAELRPLGIKVTLAELGPFATNFTRSMQIQPPAPHYDMTALAREAGNAGWGGGDDPRAGAGALVSALNDPEPPVRLLLGQPGIDVVALHEARRDRERGRWKSVSQLR